MTANKSYARATPPTTRPAANTTSSALDARNTQIFLIAAGKRVSSHPQQQYRDNFSPRPRPMSLLSSSLHCSSSPPATSFYAASSPSSFGRHKTITTEATRSQSPPSHKQPMPPYLAMPSIVAYQQPLQHPSQKMPPITIAMQPAEYRAQSTPPVHSAELVAATADSSLAGRLLASLLPLVRRVSAFLVGLVYAPRPPKQLPAAETQQSKRPYVTINVDDDANNSAFFDCVEAKFIGGGSLGFAASANLMFGSEPKAFVGQNAPASRSDWLRPTTGPQDIASLQSSLLALISMESTSVGDKSSPADQGIVRAVDRYLSVIGQTTFAESKATVSQPQRIPRSAKSPDRPPKRRSYVGRQRSSNSASSAHSSRSAVHESHTLSIATATTTTMHSLATVLNVRPVHPHKPALKNRRQKERHALHRHIVDDLLDDARRPWTTDADDDDPDLLLFGGSCDTVDFGGRAAAAGASFRSDGNLHIDFTMSSQSCISQSCVSPPAASASFTCFTLDEDFPDMLRRQQQKQQRLRPKNRARCASETFLVEMLTSNGARSMTAVISTLQPARPPPAIAWDVSADELRVRSRPPVRLMRQADARRPKSDAAAPAAASRSAAMQPHPVQPLQHPRVVQCQMQMLLTAGRPKRERQISECSDDFICFERDGTGDDDDDICYDVDYESSEFDETTDDDAETDDDDEDEDENTVRPADESDSDCESVSETNSATHQLDSGIEDKQVRFASVSRVHYLHAWNYAYREARISQWEQYGRDRVRFADRVQRLKDTLDTVLDAGHRERIWRQRFEAHAGASQ